MDTKCNNDDQITISRAIMTFVFRNTLLRVNFFPVVVFVSKVSNTNKYTILPIVSILLLFCLAHTMCLRTTPLSKQNLCSACNYVWIECVLRHTWPKNMLLRALLPPTIIHNFRIRFCLQFRFMVFVQCNFIQQDKENEKFHAIFFRVREKRARHLAQTKRAETNKIAHHKFTDHHEKHQ